jgi:hypothetical protein
MTIKRLLYPFNFSIFILIRRTPKKKKKAQMGRKNCTGGEWRLKKDAPQKHGQLGPKSKKGMSPLGQLSGWRTESNSLV